MSSTTPIEVDIRPWSDGDLPLLERLMGDPKMTEHIGGPESPEKIRERHGRYCQPANPEHGGMYVVVAGPDRLPAGSVGYWEFAWHEQKIWETGWSVLLEFQGKGLATRATLAVVELARAAGTYRYIHAFPSIHNGASNAICRKVGFTLLEEEEFEYPKGKLMTCNNWRLDLFADTPEAHLP